MTSKKTSPKRPASQDILTLLAGVYRHHGVQRDAFGRRAALPSEVARLLAQRTAEPFYVASEIDEYSITPASDHLKASQG